MIDRLSRSGDRRRHPQRSDLGRNFVANASLWPTVLTLLLFVTAAVAQRQSLPTRRTVPSSDDLYILLEEISVFSCRGVKNEIKVTEDDVNIINEKGNKVYFIKAPGNYSIHFKRIQVLSDFGYLTGEVGVTLQVPILEGPAGIRFDVPYTVIPETGLLNQQCDPYSGIVERDKRQYCRYCELCSLSEKLEEGFNQGDHQFLPGLAGGKESSFSAKCGKINSNTYEFQRSVNLPGRSELESKIRQKFSGVDAEIRKRLDKGRGRFQVFLNLISANQPPISQKKWFEGSEQCRCCGQERDEACKNVLSFLYCNVEDCKSAWAQQCLHNSARIVACYTVEFNYRVTTRHDDVIEFLRENNYPNQEVATRAPPTTTSPPSLREQGFLGGGSVTERCIAQMPAKLTHLRRYCTIFWSENICCSQCPGICA